MKKMNRKKLWKQRVLNRSKRIIFQMNHFKLHSDNSQQRSYPCRSMELLGNETNLGAHDRKFESAQKLTLNPKKNESCISFTNSRGSLDARLIFTVKRPTNISSINESTIISMYSLLLLIPDFDSNSDFFCCVIFILQMNLDISYLCRFCCVYFSDMVS